MTKSKRWLATAAAAAGMAFGAPALAQMQGEERGLYLGASLGVNDDTESVWRLLGGYRANRNFAVELGYADLGEMNIAGRGVNSSAWELLALGIYPLGERFSLYGKLGGYRGEAKGGGITERRNDLTFGFGGQYDASRNLGVRVEWQRYTDFGGGALGGVSDQDVISLSAIYRFR
jgi:OmpA-OmpF porin, OOP family